MVDYPKLNYPPLKIQLFKLQNNYFVFCPVRKKKIVLTPEEWVRQHTIAYLLTIKKYPLSKISVEKSISFNSLTKRWDIAVYDFNFKPFLLIECKAPTIKLNLKTFIQVSTYQSFFNGKFIAMTNGLDCKCFEIIAEKSLIEKEGFPEFSF